jgi:hypothetical protein
MSPTNAARPVSSPPVPGRAARRYRFHHSYRAGYWGLALGIERGLEGTTIKGDSWHIQLGRKVWVFVKPPVKAARR